jgi:hypothetical protein
MFFFLAMKVSEFLGVLKVSVGVGLTDVQVLPEWAGGCCQSDAQGKSAIDFFGLAPKKCRICDYYFCLTGPSYVAIAATTFRQSLNCLPLKRQHPHLKQQNL